jgi:uncharacterized membrane protein YphA (DoxX/SURF4 family)
VVAENSGSWGLALLKCSLRYRWVRFKSAQKPEDSLPRLYFAFPGGLPGTALLLLRSVFGLSLILEAWFYFRAADGQSPAWLLGVTALATGILLLIGYLTPLAAGVVGLGAIGIRLALLPRCTPTLFDAWPTVAFAITILLAIIALGPGAFSVDARVFGRREIVIPPTYARSGESS